jgi:hypothetical protein
VSKSWRWGCELQFICNKNLGKITWHQELSYTGGRPFGPFISYLHSMRAEEKKKEKPNNLQLQFLKTLMNSLFGKFA